MLAGYEEALPGAADRILKMAEAQQAHRLSIEDKVIDGNIVSEWIGTVAGGMVALVAIIGAMVLIAIGKSVEGLALVILEAAGVAAVFLKMTSSPLWYRRSSIVGTVGHPRWYRWQPSLVPRPPCP